MKNPSTRTYARTALLVVGAALVGGWLAPIVARAADASGASLGYAGVLRQNGAPITSPQTLGFVFKKGGTVACNPAGLQVTPDASGHFTVSIPLAGCPDTLFDGTDVALDVTVEGNVVTADQPITPVPSTKYAEQVAFRDCPPGYQRDNTAKEIVLCRKGVDEIVRVGVRSSAFWIDRYEATVWENPDGTGALYGSSIADYPIPVNGQLGATTKGYAISKAGHLPSTAVTWFQADAACRVSGKSLPKSNEWGFAARGTPDPGSSAGENGKCRTQNSLRPTGGGAGCASMWGAQDMIGNADEIVADWAAAPPLTADDPYNGYYVAEWGPDFGDDFTANLVSYAGAPTGKNGLNYGTPASTLRGGGHWEGQGAGIFNLNLTVGVQATHPSVGFRCAMRR